MQPKPDETAVFSWTAFKARAHPDQVNAKVMKDPRLAKMMGMKAIPLNAKRMIYGGFSASLIWSAHNGQAETSSRLTQEPAKVKT